MLTELEFNNSQARFNYNGYGDYVNQIKSQEPKINLGQTINDGITGANNYIKDKFTGFKDTIGDGIKGILDNTLIGRFGAANDATNPNAFNYNPDLQGQINFMKDQGMYGNNYSSSLPQIQGGVLAGQNLQSLFGSNDLTDMYANQVAKSQNTLDMIPERFSRLKASEEEKDIEAYRKKMAINQTRLNEAIAQQQLNFDRQNTMNDAQGYDATGRGRAYDYAGRDNEYGKHYSTITNKNAQINQDAGRGNFNPGTHTATNTAQQAQDYQDAGRGQRFEKGGRVGYFFGGLAARGMKR